MSQIRIGISDGLTRPGAAAHGRAGRRSASWNTPRIRLTRSGNQRLFLLPSKARSYKAWRRARPTGFFFDKGRIDYATSKRLKDNRSAFGQLLPPRGFLCLRDKLTIDHFGNRPALNTIGTESRTFRLLPCTLAAAAALARRHDPRMRKRSWTEACGVGRLRHNSN